MAAAGRHRRVAPWTGMFTRPTAVRPLPLDNNEPTPPATIIDRTSIPAVYMYWLIFLHVCIFVDHKIFTSYPTITCLFPTLYM